VKAPVQAFIVHKPLFVAETVAETVTGAVTDAAAGTNAETRVHV